MPAVTKEVPMLQLNGAFTVLKKLGVQLYHATHHFLDSFGIQVKIKNL